MNVQVNVPTSCIKTNKIQENKGQESKEHNEIVDLVQ